MSDGRLNTSPFTDVTSDATLLVREAREPHWENLRNELNQLEEKNKTLHEDFGKSRFEDQRAADRGLIREIRNGIDNGLVIITGVIGLRGDLTEADVRTLKGYSRNVNFLLRSLRERNQALQLIKDNDHDNYRIGRAFDTFTDGLGPLDDVENAIRDVETEIEKFERNVEFGLSAQFDLNHTKRLLKVLDERLARARKEIKRNGKLSDNSQFDINMIILRVDSSADYNRALYKTRAGASLRKGTSLSGSFPLRDPGMDFVLQYP